MIDQPGTFREIVRRVLGRRILQLRFANTLSYGDICKVLIQVDSGEWLEVGGMPGLTIELVPLSHPDTDKLSVGGGVTEQPPPYSTEGCISDELLSVRAANKTLRNWRAATQEAIDKAVSLLRARHDPCWLMDRAEEILRPHQLNVTERKGLQALEEVLSVKELREENTALKARLTAMQDAIDYAYNHVSASEGYGLRWLLNQAKRILRPYRSKTD